MSIAAVSYFPGMGILVNQIGSWAGALDVVVCGGLELFYSAPVKIRSPTN